MFPNLKAEMSRNGITQRDLVTALAEKGCKVCVATLSAKMTGKRGFSFAEVCAIKEILGTDMPLEELFQRRMA